MIPNKDLEAFAEKISGGDPEKKARFMANVGYESPMFARNTAALSPSPTVSDAVPDYGLDAGTSQFIAGTGRGAVSPPPPVSIPVASPQEKAPSNDGRLIMDNSSSAQDVRSLPSADKFKLDPGLAQLMGGPGATAKAPGALSLKGGDDAERMAAESQALAGQTQLSQPQIGQSINYGPSKSQLAGLKSAEDEFKLKRMEAGDAELRTYAEGSDNLANQARYYDQQQELIRQSVAKGQADEAERKAKAEQSFAELKGLSDGMDAIKEDPTGSKNNPGAKAATVLGFIFGGMAEALGAKGTIDRVAQMAQARINNDIAAQRENYNRTKDKYTAKRSEYAQSLQDSDIARGVNSLQLSKELSGVKAGLEAEMMRGNSRLERTKGEAMIADLDQRIAASNYQAQQVAVLRASMPPAGLGGGAKKGKGDDSEDKLFVPTGPNGEGFLAATKEEAIKLRGGLDESKKYADSLKQYKGSLENVGAGDRVAAKLGYTTDDMANAQSAYQGVLFRAKGTSEADLGALSGGDADMMRQFLRGPEYFSGSGARLAQIDRIMQNIESNRATMSKRHGSADVQKVTDPTTGRAAYVPQGASASQGSFKATQVKK